VSHKAVKAFCRAAEIAEAALTSLTANIGCQDTESSVFIG